MILMKKRCVDAPALQVIKRRGGRGLRLCLSVSHSGSCRGRGRVYKHAFCLCGRGLLLTSCPCLPCPPSLPPSPASTCHLLTNTSTFHTTTTTGAMAPPTRRRPFFVHLLPPTLFLLFLALLLVVDPAAAAAAAAAIAAPAAAAAAATARGGDVSASLSAPSRWLSSKARRGGAIGSGESRGSGSWEQDLKVRGRGRRGVREGGRAG